MLRKEIKNKRGFTLIEVIVVLVILGIIAAIAVPSISKYIDNSKQKARTENARAIFVISQNAMTGIFSKNQNDSIKETGTVDIDKISPKLPSGEISNNKEDIRYLKLNKGSKEKSNNQLYKLIDGYITDKALLDESMVIEYNMKTGKVLSAFYSEVKSDLGYSNSSDYNIYERDEKSLEKNETGYWGVDSTGTSDEADLKNLEAVVTDYTGDVEGNNINAGNNYGLLTAEFKLPVAAGAYNYEITLNPQNGTSETINIGTGENIEFTDINSNITDAINGNGLYFDKDVKGNTLLVLVIDTPYQGYSISKKFPNIGVGEVTATIKATGDGDSVAVTSNSEHAYFGGEQKQTPVTAYDISSIRHLNNIRYEKSTQASFVQTKDITCRDYKNDILLFTPIGDRLIDNTDAGVNSHSDINIEGFHGKYNGSSNGKKYNIYDLTISSDSNKSGLFSLVRKEASVDGVSLKYTDSYWKSYNLAASYDKQKFFINGNQVAGGITGDNSGSISNCYVEGKISTTSGNQGGIAGRNNWRREGGKIEGCYSCADVMAVTEGVSGGIAGHNCGSIQYCEVGTAMGDSDITDKNGNLLGTPYFGPVLNNDDYNYDNEAIKNNKVTIKGEFAGGIAGIISKENLDDVNISYCVNAATIKGNGEGGSSKIGGIAGHSQKWILFSGTEGPEIVDSYNSGDIKNSGIGGGIVGYASSYTSIAETYNTGNGLAISLGGGICGNAKGRTVEIRDSYNIGVIEGGTHSGVIGSSLGSATITNCAFLKNNINNSNPWFINVEMCKNDKALQNMKFLGLENANSSGVGAFRYPYPYISINNKFCDLGEKFHRTPWE